jgi:hypothetical protein
MMVQQFIVSESEFTYNKALLVFCITESRSVKDDSLMAVEIVLCYARKDERALNKLETHLKSIQREGLVKLWYDRNISAGTEWEGEIDEHLNTAQIILLLVSPDFIASEYCYGIEMRTALERHERGEAHIVPIILRPTDWETTPLGKLQALPKDGKAVVKWRSQDDAYVNIAKELRKTIEEMSKQPTVKKVKQELSTSYDNQIQLLRIIEFRDAVKARNWEQAEKILWEYPNLPEAHSLLGLSLSSEVEEYFSQQLHPSYFLQPQPVTPLYHTQFAQTQPAPPILKAVHWLEEALQRQDNLEGSVTAALALMYGYSKAYNRMIEAIQKALTINPSLISSFQLPDKLMMLIYACHDLASVEKVMGYVNLKLPQKCEVQQAMRQASDPKINPYVFAKPYIEWYAVECGTEIISRIPVKVLISLSPGDNNNELTYAQIIKKGQFTVTIPPQTPMGIDPKTLLSVDEILKHLMDSGIVLITLI